MIAVAIIVVVGLLSLALAAPGQVSPR